MLAAQKFMRREGQTAVLTLFDGDGEDEREVRVPFKFTICPHCSGRGTSSAYLGAYTASEWNEQDDDFRENYMTGAYDRPCDHCTDTPGRQMDPDYSKMKPVDRKLWKEQLREERDYQALCAAERRMGA